MDKYVTAFAYFLAEKHSIGSEDSVVIACSGGPDSMFLVEMARLSGVKAVVAHYNHMLRGEESDGDETFVRNYCESYGMVFETTRFDVATFAKEEKMSLEEAARESRYAYLRSIKEKYGSKYVLVGHHLDDSIETVVFNFIRGTKLQGLTGIVEKNGDVLRPLLSLKKIEISAWLEANGVPYRFDSSNASNDYARNRIRLDVLPQFGKINPNYRKSMSDFMKYAEDTKRFIDSVVDSFFAGKNRFDEDDFRNLDPFVKKECVRRIFEITNSGTVGLNEGLILEAIKFIEEAGSGRKKEFKSFSLTKKGKTVTFE